MFDTYSPTQKVNTNAVSGTLSKTCKDSYFQCCRIGGEKFERIMNQKVVVILQAMIMCDSYVMFEVITPENFKKLDDFTSNIRR